MTGPRCLACDGVLQILDEREARCSNPDCPAGGRFIRCGFCRESSFAVGQAGLLRCVNPKCRVYRTVRGVCPACHKASLVARGAGTFCLNRNCDANREHVEACFFCGNASFLAREDLQFCVKGECPQLLEVVRVCDACHERSFVVEASRCRNPRCETFEA